MNAVFHSPPPVPPRPAHHPSSVATQEASSHLPTPSPNASTADNSAIVSQSASAQVIRDAPLPEPNQFIARGEISAKSSDMVERGEDQSEQLTYPTTFAMQRVEERLFVSRKSTGSSAATFESGGESHSLGEKFLTGLVIDQASAKIADAVADPKALPDTNLATSVALSQLGGMVILGESVNPSMVVATTLFTSSHPLNPDETPYVAPSQSDEQFVQDSVNINSCPVSSPTSTPFGLEEIDEVPTTQAEQSQQLVEPVADEQAPQLEMQQELALQQAQLDQAVMEEAEQQAQQAEELLLAQEEEERQAEDLQVQQLMEQRLSDEAAQQEAARQQTAEQQQAEERAMQQQAGHDISSARAHYRYQYPAFQIDPAMLNNQSARYRTVTKRG